MKLIRSSFISMGVTALASAAFAEKPGMPQMDPTWFANQLVWLAISFTVLYFIVSTFIVPRVGGVLEVRQNTINEAIAKAEAFKAHAAQARGEFENRAHEVHEQVASMIAEAQAKAAHAQATELAEVNAKLEAKEAAASSKLASALESAQPELEKATADIAKAIAEKLLGTSIDAAKNAA